MEMRSQDFDSVALFNQAWKHTMQVPSVVRIEPAAKCNLMCSHCPTGTIDMVRGLMSKEVFERTLSELNDNLKSVKVVVLYHGGEPLLNKNFYAMAASVRGLSKHLLIKTVTNGMVLNPKNSLQLVTCGINEVEISLDGTSPKEMEEVRINSNAPKIVENLKNLIEIRDRENPNLKISVATTQFLRSKSDVNDPDKLQAKTPEWIKNLFGNSVNYKPATAMRWPHMIVGPQYELAWAEGSDKDECNHPTNTVTVRSNGDVVPCCYDLTSQMVMGNVMKDPLFDIFNGSKYESLRRSISQKEYKSACKDCNTVRPHVYLVKSV